MRRGLYHRAGERARFSERPGRAGDVALTHEYPSVMTGSRRAGVTEAAVKAKEAGLIDYRQGNIKILDRTEAQARAGGGRGPAFVIYEGNRQVGARPLHEVDSEKAIIPLTQRELAPALYRAWRPLVLSTCRS